MIENDAFLLLREIEEQRRGRNKNTIINHAYINSGDYRRKFDNISSDRDLNKIIYQISKKILKHRSGTLFEDMYWIDPESLTIVCSIVDSKIESGIEYSSFVKRTIKKYKNLITVHSHPNSTPPSYNDLYCNYYHEYYLGVIACHDGKVYIYSTEEEISENYYKLSAGDYVKQGYSETEAFLLVLKDLSNEGRIIFKEVTADDVRK